MNKHQEVNTLKKALGLPSLYIIAIGLIVSQGSVVSILQGAGYGGGSFLLALLGAFLLTLCYISTYSELSLMMSKAGSISTYTAVAMGHFPAIIAALSAYLAPAVFAGPAELLLLQHVFDSILPDTFSYVSLSILWFFTIMNILGINLFASVQGLISYTMLVTVIVVSITGVCSSSPGGLSCMQILNSITQSGTHTSSVLLLALWPFISLEVVCDLIEEAKNPSRHIPKAMALAAVTMLILYSLLTIAALKNIFPENLTKTDIPHLLLGNTLFKQAGNIVILILAITTTSGLISASLAAVPRLLYGMAHHKQLPAIFMRLHPKFKTPWFSILFLSILVSIPLILFKNNTDMLILLLISAATCWLLSYIIAHINLIILRKRLPDFERPFKAPLYPLPQLLGIAGMIYAIINNTPAPELRWLVYSIAATFILLTAAYSFYWLRFKQKKKLFEPEPIDQAIRD